MIPSNLPRESDIIGPYEHQKINAWDYCAAIPLAGNVTSLGRIIANLGQISLIGDKESVEYKASINGLKKGAIEVVPVVGTIFAVYALYKDYIEHKPKNPVLSYELPKNAQEEWELLKRLEEKYAVREQEKPSLSSENKSTSSILLGNNTFTQRNMGEEMVDSAQYIREELNTVTANNDEDLPEKVIQIFNKAANILEDFANENIDSAAIKKAITDLNFDQEIQVLYTGDNETILDLSVFVSDSLVRIQEQL